MSDIDRERAIELIELMMREYEENECMVCEITFGDEEFEALRFARDSLKVDEAYQLEYESTTKNSSERSEKVEVEIVAKYPFFCLVQDAIDPKYKWCVSWESLAGSVGL